MRHKSFSFCISSEVLLADINSQIDIGYYFYQKDLKGMAPVVQKVDNAIHRINHDPLNGAIGFPNTYPWDSDLSVG